MERITSQIVHVKTIKPHFHENDLEIILVLKGNVDIYKVERHVHLQEGEFTLINRNIVHYLVGQQDAYILTTKIRLSCFKDIFSRIEYVEFLNNGEYGEYERLLKDRLNAIVVDGVIRNFQYQGFHHLKGEKEFNETQLVNFLFSSYQLISHWKDQEEYLDLELQERYYFIVQYILEHMNQKIVVEDILKHIYMNATYFSQFMKKVSGVGFKEFVSYRKLIVAEGLLIKSNMSMVDIASAVGIYDMKSFYNVFKKYFHDSPAKWKDNILKITDDYQIEYSKDVLDEFVDKYHIAKHGDNTITKLYKYLLSCQLYAIDWGKMEVNLNPYADMINLYDEDYQVYKYFGAFLDFLKKKGIQLNLIYPFHCLKIDLQKQLLLDMLQVNILQLGINDMKKWKIIFEVGSIDDFQEALQLKEEIVKRFSLSQIHITLNT